MSIGKNMFPPTASCTVVLSTCGSCALGSTGHYGRMASLTGHGAGGRLDIHWSFAYLVYDSESYTTVRGHCVVEHFGRFL